MKSTRIVALTAALGATALVLSSCSSASSEASASGAPDGTPTQITYWTWTAGAEATVDAFNESQDEIEVTLETIPSGAEGYTKISNAITAGEAPDVVTIEYNRLPEFASQGLLQNLSDQVGDFNAENFPEGIADLVTLGGQTWATPYDAAPMVMYYRADLFEEWGLDVPTTWDEYRAVAEKVASEHPDTRITNLAHGDSGLLPVLSWQTGDPWYEAGTESWTVDIDNDGSMKVAEYWDSMIEDDLVSPFKAWSEEETAGRLNGSLLTILGAAWSAGSLSTTLADMAGQWRAAEIPNWGESATGNYGGTSFTVPRDSENTDAAATFIKWVTTDPAAVQARVDSAETPSSTLPANATARAAAAEAFDTTWLGGQDLFALTGELADTSIVPGWTWGPAETVTSTALNEKSATSTFVEALADAQAKTIAAMTDRGLSVTE